MGFIHDDKANKNVPNTVLKTDIRDSATEIKRILVTYRKKKTDISYSEIVYAAKNVDWNTVEFPEEYEYLIKPNS